MSSCLGIYIDKNLIKYAKLKKVQDSFKIEYCDSLVFEDLQSSLKKIINDTKSNKCPICINISNELYNYFDVFSLLESKDIKNSLNIEFEMLCDERGYDINSLESRYILIENSEDTEKYKSMYISVNKNDLEDTIDLFEKYKLYSMTPISTSISNLVEYDGTENVAIINIETETQITIIVDGQIKSVNVLNKNLEGIIESISKKQSLKEAYSVFKNITIYEKDSIRNLDEEKDKYLDIIVPVLHKIAIQTNKILKSYNQNINKVYISGLGATINNIDRYFQELLKIEKCEILKPFFLSTRVSKKYIEFNSAIALALNGLGFLNKQLNFLPFSKLNNFAEISYKNIDLKNIFKEPLTIFEKTVIRIMITFIIATIVFSIFGAYVVKNLNIQKNSLNESLENSTKQIANMETEISKIESHTNAYTAIINSSDFTTQTTLTNRTNRIISKNSIPDLLKKLMYIIPRKVQLLSIKNTESKHIVIEASSDKYEQLTYFISNIKEDGFLQNVHSNDEKSDIHIFKITIEGDLQ